MLKTCYGYFPHVFLLQCSNEGPQAQLGLQLPSQAQLRSCWTQLAPKHAEVAPSWARVGPKPAHVRLNLRLSRFRLGSSRPVLSPNPQLPYSPQAGKRLEYPHTFCIPLIYYPYTELYTVSILPTDPSILTTLSTHPAPQVHQLSAVQGHPSIPWRSRVWARSCIFATESTSRDSFPSRPPIARAGTSPRRSDSGSH